MEKCQRCNSKQAMFACMKCESFRLLCERCDNYIHSLPGKKDHNRVAMTPKGEESLRNQQNNINKLPNLKETIDNNNNSDNEDKPNVEVSSTNQNNQTMTNQDTKEISYSALYSRDYLNELKSTYKKDKIDLETQGSSLRSNLEKMRLNFSEEMKTLTRQIEEYELAQVNASKSLENKYNEKIQNLLYEKENMVSSLNDSITTLQHQNDLLHNELKTQNEENRQRAIEYERQIKQLETELLKREEENYILKSQMENIVSHNSDMLQSESTRLMTQYENKIHQILNDADKGRNQLLKVIQDRENDIKDLIASNRGQSEEMISTIKRLKEENEKMSNEMHQAIDERDEPLSGWNEFLRTDA